MCFSPSAFLNQSEEESDTEEYVFFENRAATQKRKSALVMHFTANARQADAARHTGPSMGEMDARLRGLSDVLEASGENIHVQNVSEHSERAGVTHSMQPTRRSVQN